MGEKRKDHATIGDATIYRGDAMKLMKRWYETKTKYDMICCDPPYLLTSGGRTPGGMHERMGGGDYDNGGHLVTTNIDWNDFMPWFYRLMDRGHAYVMANNRNIQPMLNAAEKAGFGFHNLLVWDKVTATANRWYMKNCEFTGLFYKGKAQQINNCSSMAGIRMPHSDESKHPTEKPVKLMEHYITNSTKPGDTVFDPFMGSGTTGVACLNTGRKFVGIEIDEIYFDVAADRLEKALAIPRQHSIL